MHPISKIWRHFCKFYSIYFLTTMKEYIVLDIKGYVLLFLTLRQKLDGVFLPFYNKLRKFREKFNSKFSIAPPTLIWTKIILIVTFPVMLAHVKNKFNINFILTFLGGFRNVCPRRSWFSRPRVLELYSMSDLKQILSLTWKRTCQIKNIKVQRNVEYVDLISCTCMISKAPVNS